MHGSFSIMGNAEIMTLKIFLRRNPIRNGYLNALPVNKGVRKNEKRPIIVDDCCIVVDNHRPNLGE